MKWKPLLIYMVGILLIVSIVSAGGGDYMDYASFGWVLSNFCKLSTSCTFLGTIYFDSPVYFRDNVTLVKANSLEINNSLAIKDFSGTTKILLNASGNIILNSGNVGIGTSTPSYKLQIKSADKALNVSNLLFVNSTNVGIGTTTPVDALHVKGGNTEGIEIESTGSSASLKMYTSSGSANKFNWRWATNFNVNGIQLLRSASEGATATTNVMSFLNDGNIGIGTTNPAYLLEVKDNGLITAVNLSGILYVDASGNEVGIGTTNPDGKLHVVSISGISAKFETTGTAGVTDVLIVDKDNDNARAALQVQGNAGATEVLFASSGGNVGIGTTAPDVPLHVQFAVATDISGQTGNTPINGLQLENTDTTVDSGVQLQFRTGDADGHIFYIRKGSNQGDFAFVVDNAGRAMTIQNDGNVGIGTTAPTAKLHIEGNASNGLALNVSDVLYVNASSGNVGIGTATPSRSLSVTGDIGLTESLVSEADLYADSLYLGYSGSSSTIFTTSTNEDLTIDPDGTGDIIIQGNVGIGTTSPKAKLVVNGSGVLLNISNSTNSFLYVDQASGGRVGIGTTAPSEVLEVVGNIELSGASRNIVASDGYLRLASGLTADMYMDLGGLLYIRDRDDGSEIRLQYDSSDGDLNLYNADGVTFAKFDPTGNSYYAGTGNVGIGTTSPTAKLVVNGSGVLLNVSNGTNSFLYVDQASGGRVGIGTTSPGYDLTVSSPSTPKIRITAARTGNLVDGTPIGELQFDGTDPNAQGSTVDAMGLIRTIARTSVLDSNMQADMAFLVKGTSANYDELDTEVMRLQYTGNVGIGTTSPGQKLTVAGTDAKLNILDEYGSDNIVMGDTGSANSAYFIMYENGTPKVHITTDPIQSGSDTYFMDSNVGIGTTNPDGKLNVNGSIRTEGRNSFVARFNDDSDVNAGVFGWNGIVLGNNVGNAIIAGQNLAGSHIDFVVNNTANLIETNDLHADHNGTIAMTILNNGNVGIGTTSPNVKLDVNGSVKVNGSLNVSGTVYASGINITSSFFALTANENNSLRFTLKNLNDSSGAASVITAENNVGGTMSIGVGSNNYMIGTMSYPNVTALISRSRGDMIFANSYNKFFSWFTNPSDDDDLNNLVEVMRLDEKGLNVTKNITAQNVFLPQYIFSHTNATIPVLGANEWTNITFSQEDTDVKQGITHTYNDGTNHTFTVMVDGIYNVDYDLDVEDNSGASSDIDVAGRLTLTNGTEVLGSIFETDITKKGVEAELSHNFLVACKAGEQFVFQFIATDADVRISTHGAFGEYPESATVLMNKIANLP